MDVILPVLPFLALLACPIMMAYCFFSMRRMGGDAPLSEEAQPPEERVAALQQQLHAIQAELTTLQSTEAQALQSADDGEAPPLIDIVPGTAHAAQRPA